jgi:hypothetical protein
MSKILYGLAKSLAYPSGKEGGYFPRSNGFYLPTRCLEEGGMVKVHCESGSTYVKCKSCVCPDVRGWCE